MPIKISEVCNVSEQELQAKGVFDGFVDMDANFYFDPSLLKESRIPEFQHSESRFKNHFQKVIKLLCQVILPDSKQDRFFREVCKMLTFPEVQAMFLGSADQGNVGNGIGKTLANSIAKTAYQIVRAGIEDPAIFELIGLLEDKIGADRISDMTISILLPDLLQYSERVAKELDIQTIDYKHQNKLFQIPVNPQNNSPIIFAPQELLRELLVSNDWSDIDRITSQNEETRERTNEFIGQSWKELISEYSKRELKRLLLDEPALFRDLLEKYKSKPASGYDFETDPLGYSKWQPLSREYSNKFPLDFQVHEVTPENILFIIIKICNQFKELVEDNGLAIHLWKDDKKNPRNERFAQLLFFGIADAYCKAHDLDLNREPNAGRGPVDFKISKGYAARVNVEIKYTRNDVLSGFNKQLPVYNKAEKTDYSILLVIRNSEVISGLDETKKQAESLKKQGYKVPEIFEVDGRIKPSASNL